MEKEDTERATKKHAQFGSPKEGEKLGKEEKAKAVLGIDNSVSLPPKEKGRRIDEQPASYRPS